MELLHNVQQIRMTNPAHIITSPCTDIHEQTQDDELMLDRECGSQRY